MNPLRWTVAAVLLLVANHAVAQSPDSADSLQQVLRRARSITVIDVNGRQFKGDVVRVNGTWLTIERPRWDQDLTLDIRRIATIKERDSLVNGGLIGLASGIGVTAVVAAAVCNGNNECQAMAAAVLGYPIVGGMIALGIGLDFAHQQTLYQAPALQHSIVFAPIIGRMTGGAAVAIRF